MRITNDLETDIAYRDYVSSKIIDNEAIKEKNTYVYEVEKESLKKNRTVKSFLFRFYSIFYLFCAENAGFKTLVLILFLTVGARLGSASDLIGLVIPILAVVKVRDFKKQYNRMPYLHGIFNSYESSFRFSTNHFRMIAQVNIILIIFIFFFCFSYLGLLISLPLVLLIFEDIRNKAFDKSDNAFVYISSDKGLSKRRMKESGFVLFDIY